MKFPLSFQVFFSTNISSFASLNKRAGSNSEDLLQCNPNPLCTLTVCKDGQGHGDVTHWLVNKNEELQVGFTVFLKLDDSTFGCVGGPGGPAH